MNSKLLQVLGHDWCNFLIDNQLRNELIHIGMHVFAERKKYTVYPRDSMGIFEVFRMLAPERVKVVIVGQDPYHDGSYHGRAFSNLEEKPHLSPSLKNILKEVEDDIGNGFILNQSPDLTRWEKQGVFLINRVLTVRRGEPRSHKDLGWQFFTDYVIKTLSEKRENIVFMLWGADARECAKLIDRDKHLVLVSGHPSPLSANRGLWFGNKHFSKANEYLKKHNKKEILW